MAERSASIRRRVLYRGQVQGVGFRFTAERIARRFDVTGFVRNLPDGCVELVIEGAADHVKATCDAICRKMVGHIDNADMQDSAASGEFQDFRIAY